MSIVSDRKTLRISVVIPVFNEEKIIGRLLDRLLKDRSDSLKEIIVVDGGSTDDTLREIKQFEVEVIDAADSKGRAAQMNLGAKIASGDILYFLHSDTLPPVGFAKLITDSVTYRRPWGTFSIRFDQSHWLLSFIAWFTRFNFTFFLFGDQSLFVTKELFEDVGGYDPEKIIFEDTDITRRLRSRSKGVKIYKSPVTTSARKFEENGVLRLTFIYFFLWVAYLFGTPHNKLLKRYKAWIRQDKL